ncbi:MAG: UDP-glucose 4-epimerase GalE [Acidobacteria bacterium]|nr:UDP-glucose 4-epimerase GalE [Acidobacteriota bacterium]
MRVLVTGGAGYIGSVVVERLVEDGHEVVVFDDLSKGHRDAVMSPAVLVEGDLADRDRLRRVIVNHQTDAVIHLAASSFVGESIASPHLYFLNNTVNSLNLLEVMREEGVRRLVFSSTASVYGIPIEVPITEETPTNPINPYGESKLAFERMLRWYDQAYGLRSISLRYFNAAGATLRHGERHDPETHLIPNILKVAAGEAPYVTIFGEDYDTPDGTCVRDYIHVRDLADAHLLALTAMDRGSRIFNLGYGSGYSVAEVVEMARQVTGRKIPTESASRRAGDPPILIASADRIRLDLGWSPEMSELDQIIESAWRWQQDRR